jgi:hypothetical protein
MRDGLETGRTNHFETAHSRFFMMMSWSGWSPTMKSYLPTSTKP